MRTPDAQRSAVKLLLILLILPACGSSEKKTPADPWALERPSARIACEDFRRALNDLHDRVLTGEEFRVRIQAVERNARLTRNTTLGVAQPARDLLAALTNGTEAEATAAMVALTAACKEILTAPQR